MASFTKQYDGKMLTSESVDLSKYLADILLLHHTPVSRMIFNRTDLYTLNIKYVYFGAEWYYKKVDYQFMQYLSFWEIPYSHLSAILKLSEIIQCSHIWLKFFIWLVSFFE